MTSPEELARRYMSPRAIEIDGLDRYVKGTQYEGRVDWFDNSSQTPVVERKPCIKYPIAKSAIGSHVSFVLGEGRWPKLTSATSEDDRSIDEEWGLGQAESDLLDRFVNVILVKYAGLKRVSREMLADAMGTRSVAAVVSVQQGRVRVDTIRASWCAPTLDALGVCVSLEIRYPYIDTFFNDQAHKWEKRCLLYRRVIDAESDTVYLPAEADPSGKEPDWTVDKAKTRKHGLGFCPVVWYPFLKPCAATNTIDGVAIHEHQLEEIDCLNITLSQKQRAAVMAGDPQMYETGVAEDVNPAPVGQMSRGIIDIRATAQDGKPVGIFASAPASGAMRRMLARKKGAGVVWRYPDPQSKVGYLTIPADALKAVDDHAKDLRGKIAESFFAVFIDPNELHTHAAMSGKALSFMFSRQLAFDDGVRDDFADNGLVPLVSMVLRVVLAVGRKNPGALYLPGVRKLIPILEKFERPIVVDEMAGEELAEKAWMPPRLEPVWGPYFAPNEQDQLAVVQAVCAALKERAITREMAVEKLAQSGVFDVASAKEVVAAIDGEEQQSEAALHGAIKALGGQAAARDSADDSQKPSDAKDRANDAEE